MVRLSNRARQWVKVIHIASAGLWFGGAMSMLVLVGLAGHVAPRASAGMIVAAQVVDSWVTIPGGVIAMVTGLCFSIFTQWGFFKHAWVTVKWIITVACIFAGALWLGPLLGRLVEASVAGQGVASYAASQNAFVGWHLLQTALVFFMIVISTLKPWKRRVTKES